MNKHVKLEKMLNWMKWNIFGITMKTTLKLIGCSENDF